MKITDLYSVQEDYNFQVYNFEYDQWQNHLSGRCMTSSYNSAKDVYLDDPKHRRIIKVTPTLETYNTESESNWLTP